MKAEALERWTVQQAAELYHIRAWSAGFFDINDKGEVVVKLPHNGDTVDVSLMEVVAGIKERGMGLPVLLRFRDILDRTIQRINDSFAEAIQQAGYRGRYRGVYPIKVNQQQQVVEEIAQFGRRYHHGLEAGSKAELLIALAYMQDPEAYIVCNGYKDAEFIDLALSSLKMGAQTLIVLEMPSELDLVLERAARLGVRPRLGVRLKLSSRVPGKWTESSGDRSTFGLTMAETIRVVDALRAKDMLDCLQMVHYHLGSQIPNIGAVRAAAQEAARVYCDLAREGAAMGIFDVGGGLAVDYDGSRSNFPGSRNYDLKEYCADIVETIMNACDKHRLPHPDIISESGRFLVSYSSVLVFNILDVDRFEPEEEEVAEPGPEAHPSLRELWDIHRQISPKNLQECFNDAIYHRDQIRTAFLHNGVTLRQRAHGETLFWRVVARILRECRELKHPPPDLVELQETLGDIYFGNFSVFQSLPDSWAIGQLFPIMPIHRLHERPTRQGSFSDITCDCDGKIDHFIDPHDVKRTLPLHELRPGEDYLCGVFLVGAYQETLGDLHNLFGDTNIVSVKLDADGRIDFTSEVKGDSVADVLGYVEYDPKDLIAMFRDRAERAVREGRLTPTERREIVESYAAGIQGYTYFEP
ncbi:MAG: biosynthetic arginine decarboxylase [Planctomycetota bacterium]|nr:biosynthetic arginine decarboxylase [Planctomycetota bacterium]MCX8040331.1 biosynthetic arginine decarboxylase [Planctomycetota bacterium]MDW8373787.1 biosynthetic arginine decarboxylase [Planctomycetota bacterium]